VTRFRNSTAPSNDGYALPAASAAFPGQVEQGGGHPPMAHELLAALTAGSLTAREIATTTLAAIRTQDRAAAFVACAGDALAEAAARIGPPTAERPLAGLPIAVKDIFDTADMPTDYGSAAYTQHFPARDAAIVAEMKMLGALIVGKTATTEFAAWPPAKTRNPHDYDRTPGGSSAGSAAAVAAGLVPLALGTQTLGSVIRPASFCGVVGFKPTYGRLSRVGVKALADSLDTIGFFARSVADVRLLYKALLQGGQHEGKSCRRLAFLRGPHWMQADMAAREAIQALIARLRDGGREVVDLELPDFAEISQLGRLVHDYELSRGLIAELMVAGDVIAPSMREGILKGRQITASEHADALNRLDGFRNKLGDVVRDYDAVLSLAALGEAPLGLNSTGNPLLNIGWTALHMPSITLPVMHGANGMPIGLQLSGDRYDEDRLLAVALELEALLK